VSAFADLHLHTSFSDGLDTPETVVARAAALGFRAIAIVDHDTVDGLADAATAVQRHDIELIYGVEISASFARAEVHVVGLGIAPADHELRRALRHVAEARRHRAQTIIQRLVDLGIDIDEARVMQRAGTGSLGRLHIARELHALGVTQTVQQAFDRYIGSKGRAFVPKPTMSCDEAIALVHAAGGLAFLGHPGVGVTVRKRLPQLIELPFDGIEVYHSKHSPGLVKVFLDFVQKNGLLVAGGSDCHGGAQNGRLDIGKVHVPYRHVERIKEVLAQRAREHS